MEEWRPVQEFEGVYEISSLGRVRRVVSCMGGTAGTILRPWISGAGYLYVGLRLPGRRKRVGVHRLVAVAFLGQPTPERPEVNHLDGDKTNNAVGNLEWVSHGENHKHAYRTGLSGLIAWNTR